MELVQNKITDLESLLKYLAPIKPYDHFQNVNLVEVSENFTIPATEKAKSESPSFTEFKEMYKRLWLEEDENGKFLYFLDKESDPSYWKYYQRRTKNELEEDVEEYRRIFPIVEPWHELSIVTLGNLITIDLGDQANYDDLRSYFHIGSSKMYIRIEHEIEALSGLLYDPENFKAIEDGQELLFDFIDEEGYSNSKWDQFFKRFIQGAENLNLDQKDRKVKFNYRDKPGLLSFYPRIFEGNGIRRFKVKYEYLTEKRRRNLKGAHKKPFSSSKFNLFNEIDLEKYALEFKFESIYGFLHFINKVFFEEKYFYDFSEGRKEIRVFYKKYLEIVKNAFSENSNNLPEQYKLLYFIPPEVIKYLDNGDLWRFLDDALLYFVSNLGTDREDVIFKLVSVLSAKYNPDIFLNLLLKSLGNENRLNWLFYRLDNNNFTKFVYLIWGIWADSGFFSINAATNKVLPKDFNLNPLLIPYNSDTTLSFHTDNAKIHWTKNFKNIKVDITQPSISFDQAVEKVNTFIEDEVHVENLIESYEDGSLEEELEKLKKKYHSTLEINKYTYHPFCPIAIVNKSNPNFIFGSGSNEKELVTIMPAFILLAREQRAFWANLMTAGEYLIDIISIAGGYLTILKGARILKSLNSGKSVFFNVVKGTGKTVAGSIYLTAGVGRGILRLTETQNSKIGQMIGEILFYLEIAAMIGEVGIGLLGWIRKAALKAAYSTELKKLKIELKKVIDKNLDEAQKLKHADEIKGAKEQLAAIEKIEELAGLNKRNIFLRESRYYKTSAKFAKKSLKEFDNSPKAIKDFEEIIQNSPDEWLGVYNTRNETFRHKPGVNPGNVKVPTEFISRRSIFTHNHPKNTGISLGDIETFIRVVPEEIRAITPNGDVFSLKNIGLNLRDRERLLENFEKIRKNYSDKFDNLNKTRRKVGESAEALKKRLQPEWDDLLDQEFKEVFELIEDKVTYTHYF